MKVIHVVARMVTASSGPSYSVPCLCRAIMDEGVEIELHMTGDRPDIDPKICVHTYPVIPFLRPLAISPAMRRGLSQAAAKADIMHSHNLWMLPNVYPGYVTQGAENCDLVLSPRGTLSDWAMNRSRIKKKLLWWAGQRRTLASAACLHATSDEECDEIRNRGFDNPVSIIPNGIDIPLLPSSRLPKTPKKLLFLSRIHPKKGMDKLIDVWSDLAPQFPEWSLQIAGPLDSAYPQQIQTIVKKRHIPRIEFLGEVVGEEKHQAYFDADLFVLPTNSENFGVVVAEALAHGVPVVVTKGAPWKSLKTHQCGWWIENNKDALGAQLKEAMSLSPEVRREMGMNGRRWMASDFSWQMIARRMIETYQWIKQNGSKPDCLMV